MEQELETERKKFQAVIGINGPAKSGKGFIIRWLADQLIKNSNYIVQTVHISEVIFESMILERTGTYPSMSVHEFKSYGGEKARLDIITYAENRRRHEGDDVFLKMILDNQKACGTQVLIFDNVGFYHETEFWRAHSNFYSHLRLALPFKADKHYTAEELQAYHAGFNKPWPGDSRRPIEHIDAIYASTSDWLGTKLTALLTSDHMVRSSIEMQRDPTNQKARSGDDEFNRIWRYNVLGFRDPITVSRFPTR